MGSSNPSTAGGPGFSEETVQGGRESGWRLMDPGRHHPESTGSQTSQAGFSFQLYSFLTVCPGGARTLSLSLCSLMCDSGIHPRSNMSPSLS